MPDERTTDASLLSPRTDTASKNTLHPVRGALRLDPSVSSPQVTAGADFSIFLTIQNPFDIPVTVYAVQSHIPIELVDMNGYLTDKAAKMLSEPSKPYRGWWRNFYGHIADWFADMFDFWRYRSGVAAAVSTSFSPERLDRRSLFNVQVSGNVVHGEGRLAGIQFILPEAMASEEVAHTVQRLQEQVEGIAPVVLQPGDSVAHQFVLRTRRWLFFTPLTHEFQIQVNFATEGIRHYQTISFQLSIRATILAMAIGAIAGAIIGTSLKTLSAPKGADSVWRAVTVAVLASFAVVVAFARKSNAQSLVSVEDFWGGALIGFSVGFFGFEQFSSLFSISSPPRGTSG